MPALPRTARHRGTEPGLCHPGRRLAAIGSALKEGITPDCSEVVFTGPFEREVRVSADRQSVTHRAMAWSAVYSLDELPRWISFYEQLAEKPTMLRAQADVEVLHRARDLLARKVP